MQLPPIQLVRTAHTKSFPSKSLVSLLPRTPFATPMTNGKGRSKHRGYNSGQSRGSGTGRPKKPPLTHFLCFPLVNATSKPQLQESLRHFQSLISTSAPPNQSIPELKPQGNHETTIPTSSQSNLGYVVNRPQLPAKAIRPLGTLHLTLGVMSLESEDRVQGAINLLRVLDPMQMIMDDVQQTQKNVEDKAALTGPQNYAHPNEVILSSIVSVKQTDIPQSLIYAVSPPQTSPSHQNPTRDVTSALPSSSPIIISLTSLHSMHNPKSTSILYANPYDSTDRLFPLGQKLRTIFEENEYMIKDTRPLKLHATVVNMIYARAGGRHNSRRQTKPSTLGTTEAADSVNLTSTMMTGATEPVALESLTTDGKNAGCDADATVNEQEGEAQCEEPKMEDCSNSYGRNTHAPICFDSTALLEQFKDFVWAGDFRIEKVAICKMGAKKIFDERGEVVGEEYEEVAYVDLP